MKILIGIDPVLTEFGKVIRKSRIEAGISMAEMSKRIGVSTSFASATEKGLKKIPIPYAKKLKKFFDDLGIYEGEICEIARITNLMTSEGINSDQACLINDLIRRNLSNEAIDEIFTVAVECDYRDCRKND